MIKKSKSFILFMFIFLFLLSSCKSDKTNINNQTTDTVEETVVENSKVIICENSTINYTIIIPDDYTDEELDYANEIKGVIEELTGLEIKVQTDFISPRETYDSSTCEILIGNTSRDETNQSKDEISYNEYAISYIGNKIVIFSYSSDGMTKAIDEFEELLKNTAYLSDSNSIVIEGPTTKNGSTCIWALPKYEGGQFEGLFDCGDEVTMACISETDGNEFDIYVNNLKNNGYEQIQSNQIGDNVYFTFHDLQYRVFVYYTSAYSEVRIIQEKYVPYSTSTEETGSVETALFATTANDKAPYVLKLSDNSLIVFDGHVYSDGSVTTQLSTFYKELVEICGDDDIKITAWFISHAHADHTNMLNMLMMSPYASKITLERVILNVSSIEDLAAVENNSCDNYLNYSSIVSNIGIYSNKYGIDTQIIKAHTGQIFSFCGAVFEILYTHEDYLPRTYPIEGAFGGNGINSHSIVMKMTVGDLVTIWTGDMSNEESVIVEKTYGNQLKCDIVQVGHHGNNTAGEVSFYLKCDPQILLWTNSYDKFVSEVLAYNRSGALIYNALKDKVLENVYLCGDSLYKISFESQMDVDELEVVQDSEGIQYGLLHQ